MPLDWFNTPLDADIGELIAQRKRGKAIEALRAQVQGRLAPSVNVRLQLADLLIQAGRGAEAIPVLIALADAFSADGFVAKAVAILKRVEKLEPNRPDVRDRLTLLVHQQKRAIPPAAAFAADPRPRLLEIGIEELVEGEEAHLVTGGVPDDTDLDVVVATEPDVSVAPDVMAG